MMPLVQMLAGIVAVLAGLVSGAALAHPHILATASIDVVFSANGDIQAVRQTWIYDPAYSSFALRKLDADGDGQASPSELADFAKTQLADLRAYDFFTIATKADVNIEMTEAVDYSLLLTSAGGLALSFTLPFKAAVAADQPVSIALYDPHFFAYFTMSDRDDPVGLVHAPAGCATTVSGPKPVDLKQTRSIPSAFWAALDGSSEAGKQFVNRIVVSCP